MQAIVTQLTPLELWLWTALIFVLVFTSVGLLGAKVIENALANAKAFEDTRHR